MNMSDINRACDRSKMANAAFRSIVQSFVQCYGKAGLPEAETIATSHYVNVAFCLKGSAEDPHIVARMATEFFEWSYLGKGTVPKWVRDCYFPAM